MLMPRYSDQDNNRNNNSFIRKHHHTTTTTTTVAAHTKMRLLSKVEHNMRQNQQQIQNSGHNPKSINKLINTAATANGIVGDVDELLTPMPTKCQVVPSAFSIHGNGSNGSKESNQSRPERNLWSRAEMLEMLNIMQQVNALDQLNDRNVKSEHVFRRIEEIMRSKGYVKKSSIQIWTKWKFLKSTYNTTTRHGNGVPKFVPEEVYRVLCRMLRENANANGSGSRIGSECGNSMDSSNADLGRAVPESEECNDELGVEHPIFGFRLGLVKPEPLDTGYETALNSGKSSEPESESVEVTQSENKRHEQTRALDHTPFIVTVKHEPEMDLGMDGTNTPPPTAPTSPSPPPASVEHCDLSDRLDSYASVPQSTPLRPLRVAAFANNSQQSSTSTPTHGILHTPIPISRSPNNGGSGKSNRSMTLQSTSNISFVHPTSKLMLPRKQPMRIPREISVQSANMRPLKAVPMRETGYSLRPDRMILDLEESISPPQSPSPPMHHSQHMPKLSMSYASTSRYAQLLGEQQQSSMRKRRLQNPQPSPVPVKLQRSSTLLNPKRFANHQNDDASAEEEYKNKEDTQRRKQQQDELLKTELSQFSNAMRVAQKEMLQDFFEQQKLFARREHEFQLRQDNLVMSALRKQTDALLRTAKDLMKVEEETQEMDQLDEPEIELQEESVDEDEDEDEEESEAELHQGLDHYEDDTQFSDDGNKSHSAIEPLASAVSDDASIHSDSS